MLNQLIPAPQQKQDGFSEVRPQSGPTGVTGRSRDRKRNRSGAHFHPLIFSSSFPALLLGARKGVTLQVQGSSHLDGKALKCSSVPAQAHSRDPKGQAEGFATSYCSCRGADGFPAAFHSTHTMLNSCQRWGLACSKGFCRGKSRQNCP